MNDHRLRELLDEAVAEVEPAERLAEIRTRVEPRRSTRRRVAPVAAALVAASVVAAVAVAGQLGGLLGSDGPTPSRPAQDPRPAAETTVAVYYPGDTPFGERLYREFRRLETTDPLTAAVGAAVGRDVDGSPLSPLDPDYRVPWPAMTAASAEVVEVDGDEAIRVDLGGDPETDLRRRGPLTSDGAVLAVQQLVYTAQAAVQRRLPVRFTLFGEPTDQLLGQPVEDLAIHAPVLDVLSNVSLSDPSEGRVVRPGEPLRVRGVANSHEGNVVVQVRREGDGEVVAEVALVAGWMRNQLFPFEHTFDLSDVPAGDYVVHARTDDPSGAGMVFTDTRSIRVE